MEDKQIIDMLFSRDEQGLRMIEDKYANLYKSILRQALSDKSDIDECANDVLMALWNSIPPNYPDHFPSYIGRIARRIGINCFKHNTRHKRNSQCTVLLSELEGCIPSNDRVESRLEAMHLRRVLNVFFAGSGTPDQSAVYQAVLLPGNGEESGETVWGQCEFRICAAAQSKKRTENTLGKGGDSL